ncbi:MAG: site-2 protease family protein [Janthinobacterium lividum]
MSTAVLPPESALPAAPETIHSCPNCGHWLPDGTLACPDCQTLTYGRHLGALASSAQELEKEGKWPEARDRWQSALVWIPEGTPQAESIGNHIAGIDARLNAEVEKKARWTKRLGPFAPVFFFLLKAKSALFFLFKLKFFLGLFGFFALYWALAGWQFALGATACVFIHEMGHFVAVKRRGLKAEWPMFIPGMGAYVKWYSQGASREDLAAIALAGPLFGLASAVFCAGLAFTTHRLVFLVIANFATWINLFNLTPVLGFDGAQAAYALSRMQRILLTVTCLLFFGLTVANASSNMAGTQWVFLIVAAGMGWRSFANDVPETPHSRTMITFLGLILALGFILYLTPIPGTR